MDSPAIRFNKVAFRYGRGHWIFKDFDLSLATCPGKGRIVALMGPSGVGKSTFCDLVLGSRIPLAGTIDRLPMSAGVAFIPQRAVLFEELDVVENINCLRHSRSLGPTFRPERFDGVVQSLGLQSVVERNEGVMTLSGGEAQRVMLARIGMVDCKILVLDEPCSFLDNRVKEMFLDSLRKTVDQYGILALLVTHVWDEATLIADEILTFHQEGSVPVKISRDVVYRAFHKPPTIDAMYAIHWPRCKVLRVEDVRHRVPDMNLDKSATWIGLFDTGDASINVAPWMISLWKDADLDSTAHSARSILRTQIGYSEPISLSAATFTQNGRLISLLSAIDESEASNTQYLE